MLGFIYFQIVQFVLLVYYLLSYVELVEWDCGCFCDVCKCFNESLLGCVVLVGMVFLIDCEMMVSVLGFDWLMVNFFDGVVVCDFVFEVLFVVLICVVNLLCFVEEIVFWCIKWFQFVILLDVWLIGFFIML